MKKEDILKLFPSVMRVDLNVLPEEIVACWYPSSGIGCEIDVLYNGYQAVGHWRDQPSKLKPNLFIFSDIEEFDIHQEAEVLYSATFYEDPIIEFLNNPADIDFNVLPADHSINKFSANQFVEDLRHLFELGMVDEDHFMTRLENANSPDEAAVIKFEIKLLMEAGVFSKEKIIDKQKRKESSYLLDVVLGPIKALSIIKYLDTFFILVRTTNKHIYNRFLDESVKIPLLTLNRPQDNFVVFENGIDIEKLGIQEFIAGHSYVSSLIFGEEFKKYPDFLFQLHNGHDDLANLYSIRN
jgi:hypothetical protein